MKEEKAIGIDLGTTNSVVGVLDASDARLLLARHGPEQVYTMPSAVAWDAEKGQRLVGHLARARRGRQPAPVLSVKSKMGTGVTVDLAGEETTPVAISAWILGELVERIRYTIRADGGDFDVRRAVITVPAHFGMPEQEATTEAGEIAGLEVLEVLHEPVAAVLHYCWQRDRLRRVHGEPATDLREELFVVYDLGGGTFDASVVKRLPDGSVQTIGIAGDSVLGGDNFDRDLADSLFKRVASGKGLRFDSLSPADARNHLRFAKLQALAEWAKIELSDRVTPVEIDLPDAFEDDAGRKVHVQATYSREDFDRIIRSSIERTIRLCREALDEAQVRVPQIDEILLVGGSSRIPLVKAMVRENFCSGDERAQCELPRLHAAELCVGAGACLKAASHGRIWTTDSGKRIHSTGYGTTSSPHATLRVEALDLAEGDSLSAVPELASRSGLRVKGETLAGGRRALFDDVALAPGQNSFFTLRLPTAGGSEAAGFEICVRQDDRFVPPVAGETSANVLSYALELDVMDPLLRTPKRVLLAPKLSALPNEFVHIFSAPGEAQQLRFPVFGDGQPIKTAHSEIQGVPRGTLVHLTVHIDEAQRVRCDGRIPDAVPPQEFHFDVDSPEPEPVPTWDEYQDLKIQYEQLVTQLPREDALDLGLTAQRLWPEIERAFDRRDDATVLRRCRELSELLREYDPSRLRMQPPIETVEELVSECRRLIGSLALMGSSLQLDEERERVDENDESAHDAAAARPPNRNLYARCVANLEKARTHLREEHRLLYDAIPPAERAPKTIAQGNEIVDQLSRVALTPEQQQRFEDAARELREAESYELSDPEKAHSEALDAARELYQVLKETQAEPGEDPDDESGDLLEELEGGAR